MKSLLFFFSLILVIVGAEFQSPTDVKHLESVSISIPRLKVGKKRLDKIELKFSAHNRDFHLELQPYDDLFSPDALFYDVQSANQTVSFEFDTSVYYRGHVIEKERSSFGDYSVGLTIDPQEDLVTGFIHTHNESYALEPSSRYFNKRTGFQMVMYRWSDVEMPPNFCGVKDHDNNHDHDHDNDQHRFNPTKSLVANARQFNKREPKACRISLVGDSWWYQDGQGSSLTNSVRAMVESVITSNTIYRRDIGSGFQIISTYIYTNPSTDPFRTPASSSINDLLTTLNTEKSNIQPTAGRCLIHEFTYVDYSGTIGLAYVGVLCRVNGGAGVTTGKSFGRPLSTVSLALTVAHEIGHNHNSGHDPASSCSDPIANRQFIMAACSGSSTNLLPFSTASIGVITTAVNSATCLADLPLSLCGNGFVEAGEQCDCGSSCSTDPWCSTSCTLAGGAQCSPSAGSCCNPSNGQFYSSSTTCGTSPYSFIPPPRCSGSSAGCTQCYFGHPCDKYSNLSPCQHSSNPCKSSCVFSGQTNCVAGTSISGLDPNLPDGTCCTTSSIPRGTCVAGTCTASCIPTTCAALGKNCGSHSNGCGGTLNCGTCSGTCNNGVCCIPQTCASLGKTCGSHSNGCGGTLSCGTCPGGVTCPSNGVCPSCVPTTCAALDKNCGSHSDGCGGTLSCGTCTSPNGPCNNGKCCIPIANPCQGLTCGEAPNGCGGFMTCGTCTSPNQCNINTRQCECKPNPQPCAGVECGTVNDGCGSVTCNSCPSGRICTNGVCVCQPTSSCGTNSCGVKFNGCENINCGGCTSPNTCNSNTNQCECVPATCASLGKTCGSHSNNCGGTLSCGTCGTGFACENGQCNPVGCTPTTSCSAQGRVCGTINNGCATVSCGSCTAPATCTTQGQCVCTPTTTCAASSRVCGTLYNGCTTLICGNCTAPATCTTQGQCVCTPTTTCAQAERSCGTLYNGCETLNCGTCVAPAICSGTQCVVEGCQPTTSCLDSNRECGTLDDGCTTITCGTCSEGLECSTDGLCLKPDQIEEVIQTKTSNRSLIIGIAVAGGACLLFIILGIIIGILYYRRRKENRRYSVLDMDEYDQVGLAPTISSPEVSSPNPQGPPPGIPPRRGPPPTGLRTMRKPPPPPVKKLPPPPPRPLPAPGTMRPGSPDVPQRLPRPPPNVPRPPVEPGMHSGRGVRATVKIPAPVVIPQSRPLRQPPGPGSRPGPTPGPTPGPRPVPQPGTARERPLPAPGQQTRLAPRQPRPKSVKRPLPQPGTRAIGENVQAKYSQDGKFYPAVIDDIQHGYYLVRYPDYQGYQEWVPVADLK